MGSSSRTNSICSLQQFIEDRVYDDDGDPTSTDGDGAVQRQKLSREEAEAEFAAKASVALQAGQKFLTENFDQIRVSQGCQHFHASVLVNNTLKSAPYSSTVSAIPTMMMATLQKSCSPSGRPRALTARDDCHTSLVPSPSL